MPDQILGSAKGTEVLVALAHCIGCTSTTAVFAVCHQDGYLGAQFRQFEGT
jgi:hypothetical protein